jgi:hypothetical protein
MASFTFFEIHLHDGFSLSNSAPFVSGGDDEEYEELEAEREEDLEEEIGEEIEEYEESSGSGAGRALLVLVLLVGAALAVKKMTGGDDEYEELEDLDDLSEPEAEQ